MDEMDRLHRRLSLELIVRRALDRFARLSALSANPFIGEVPRKGYSGEATTSLESLRDEPDDPDQPPEPR